MRAFTTFVLVFLIPTIQTSYSARILALFPIPLKSHFTIFDVLFVELANRGHNVTVTSPYPKKHLPANYHQIDTSDCVHLPDKLFTVEFRHSAGQNSDVMFDTFTHIVDSAEEILKCDPMQKLLHSTDSYDLLMTEMSVSDTMLGYVHLFQTPFILLSSYPLMPWASQRVGNVNYPSYVPFPWNFRPLGESPSFYDRLYNTQFYLRSLFYHSWKWTPHTNELVRRYFGEGTPSVTEIAKNVSLILCYSHFSTNVPRPSVPAVIDVGGLHIESPAPLPKDIDKFISESSEGVIYFCLGSVMQAETMSPQKRDAFINAFEQLPQRVLWKWEAQNLPRKPKNIMIQQWMPQRDILAHSNVKLFITHGGLLGTNEVIHEGVPVIGIPFTADQFVNLKFIESAGVGEILHYKDITTDAILMMINAVLNNTKYGENAKRLSLIHKDRPLSPIETAIYWTEYVIRHKEARHLQSATVHLTWYQYYLLDVSIALLTSAIILLMGLFLLSKKLIHLVVGSCSTKTCRNSNKINSLIQFK